MRRAAIDYTPPDRPILRDPSVSWLKRKVLGIWFAVIGVLSRPAYAVPLLLNITGSVWFFVLIGKAGTYTLSVASMSIPVQQVVEHGIHRREDGGMDVMMLTDGRIEPYGPHYEFAGVSFYGLGGVVGGEKGYHKRYLDWDGIGAWGDCVMRPE